MEKYVIRGKFVNIIREALVIFLLVFVGGSAVIFILHYMENYQVYTDPEYARWFGGAIHFAIFRLLSPIALLLGLAGGLVFYLLFKYKNLELNVTDRRVYGVAEYGRRFDLPLDSITEIGISTFHKIIVRTSSGEIRFSLLKNYNEVHRAISDLLVARQNPVKYVKVVGDASSENSISDVVEEIKKYKELLDSGVITQEEFDAKKKQLLNL